MNREGEGGKENAKMNERCDQTGRIGTIIKRMIVEEKRRLKR